MSTKFLFADVISYDEGDDTFKLGIPVIETSDPAHPGRECMNDSYDFDDQTIDAGLFAFMVGVSDEPTEFVGKRFKIVAAQV